MAIEVVERDGGLGGAVIIGARKGAALWYSIYGLRVRSDLPLPIAAMPRAIGQAPDWIIRRAAPGATTPSPDGPLVAGLPCNGPCHNGRMVTLVHRGSGGTWFWHDSVGTCHVAPDGRVVDVYLEPEADPRTVGLVLAGQVATFVMHTLGYPSLHASAVTTPRGAVAFLGPAGQGKSTMAAAFLRRGATLLTDDVLPLREVGDVVCGGPSLPMMKVWGQTARHTLALRHELPSLTDGHKKRLLVLDGQYAFASEPVPMRAVYVLERYEPLDAGHDSVSTERLNGRDSIAALLNHTLNRAYLQPGENAALPRLYARLLAQAPARLLRYPTGFGLQEAVYQRIMDDLEEGSAEARP